MATRSLSVRVLFTAGLLALTVFAFSPLRASAGTKTTPDLSTITSQVHHELAMLPWYGVFDHLEYQVNGTEVTLTGEVVSQHAVTKDDAGRFVRSIPGVTKVVNNIEVLPPSLFDDQIRRAEYRKIFSQASLGGYSMGAIPQLHIVVKNGHVALEGVVMNQMDKTVAGMAANTVPGVFSVENNLRVGS